MANIWKCSCGQDNDGNFCINCGSTKPEGAENTVGAPAPVPAAVAPAETPAAIAPAEPESPAPAAAPVEPVKAEEPEAPAAEPAPAVAPVVAPVAAAAAVAAAATDEEPVQVIKCQPMPETPMEDYSSVPADPEFAEKLKAQIKVSTDISTIEIELTALQKSKGTALRGKEDRK